LNTIRLTIAETLPTLNMLLRLHWSKRRRIQSRVSQLVWLEMQRQGLRPASPITRCRIRIRRYSRRSPDVDSLPSTGKLLLDVLQPASRAHPQGLGVIADDTPECIVDYKVEHVAGKNRMDIESEPIGVEGSPQA